MTYDEFFRQYVDLIKEIHPANSREKQDTWCRRIVELCEAYPYYEEMADNDPRLDDRRTFS